MADRSDELFSIRMITQVLILSTLVVQGLAAEAPTIIEPPETRKVVAEGTSVSMTCRVTGKPDPVITWFKDQQQITGGRYQIQSTGDLHITQVVLSDAGLFRCEAENALNKTSASGLLLVRRKTQIEQAPVDLEVNAGTDAKLTCSGTTDPKELDKLQIKWLKDSSEISMVDPRVTINSQDNSLTISGTFVRDSGSYTCVATNGLDQAEASALLTVTDRPDAPSKVDLLKCNTKATIVWTPGSYNNAPVQYYIIQYNTSFNPDTWTFATKVDSMYSRVNVSLSPWANYTFRVIAHNKIGESDPSSPTAQICRTKDDLPDSNPKNLRTIGNRKNYLHIEWTPMPQIQHNGEGFQYILQISREGYGDQGEPIPIDDWRIHRFLYPTIGQVYEPYIITLRVRNSFGFPRQDPTVIRGFTGEAIPQIAITNAGWYAVGDTYVELQWDMDARQINSNPTQLNGEFRGFKIQLWQQNHREETLREWDISPEDAMAGLVGNTFRARVENLLPSTSMEATVAVMNNYYVSKPSDIFCFTTKADVGGQAH